MGPSPQSDSDRADPAMVRASVAALNNNDDDDKEEEERTASTPPIAGVTTEGTTPTQSTGNDTIGDATGGANDDDDASPTTTEEGEREPMGMERRRSTNTNDDNDMDASHPSATDPRTRSIEAVSVDTVCETTTQRRHRHRRRRRPSSTTRTVTTATTPLHPPWTTAQTRLVDRLIRHFERSSATLVDTRHGPNGGLTLPALAVAWLTSEMTRRQELQAMEDNNNNNNNNETPADTRHTPSSSWTVMRSLLSHASNVRLTNDAWPSPTTHASRRRLTKKRFPAWRSAPSSTQPPTEESSDPVVWHRPVLDLAALVPNVRVLWLDQVPLSWIVAGSSHTASSAWRQSLTVWRIQRVCLFQWDTLVSMVRDDNNTGGLPRLTRLEVSHCQLEDGGWHRPETDHGTEDAPSGPTTVAGPATRAVKEMGPTPRAHTRVSGRTRRIRRPLSQLSCCLQSFTVSHNALRSLPLVLDAVAGSRTTLRHLDVSHNQLGRVTLADELDLPTSVRSTLSHRALRSPAPPPPRLLQLRVLILSHNRLQQSDVTEWLSHCTRLQTLHLDYNCLTDVHAVSSFLASLPDLKDVALQGNPFRTIESRRKTTRPTMVSTDGATRTLPSDETGPDRMHHNEERPAFEAPRRNGPWVAKVAKRTAAPPSSATLHYRVDVLNAFRERRMSGWTASELEALSMRQVQDRLPTLDGVAATASDLRALRERTSVPAVAPTTRSVVPTPERPRRRPVIADSTHAAWSKPRSARPNQTAVALFSTFDVVQSLAPARIQHGVDDGVPEPPFLGDVSTDHGGEICSMDSSDFLDPPFLGDVCSAHGGTSMRGSSDGLSFYEENIGVSYLACVPAWGSDVDKAMDSNVLSSSFEHLHGDFVSRASPQKAARRESDGKYSNTDEDLRNLSLSRIEGAEDVSELNHGTAPTDTKKTDCSTETRETTKNGVALALFPDVVTTPVTGTNTVRKAHPSSASFGSSASPNSASPNDPTLFRISSFSENHWQGDFSTTSPVPGSSLVPKQEDWRMAEETSKFDGPYTYKKLRIRENLELYFRLFVFASLEEDANGASNDVWRDIILTVQPKIQLWPIDRKRRREDAPRGPPQLVPEITSDPSQQQRETFRRVWKERVVGCGKAALQRLTPNRSARYGFHGELLWSNDDTSQMKPEVVVEGRELICCFSDQCFYLLADHDIVTEKSKDREFPRPMAENARFRDAKWPHALACHSFPTLKRITIGFSFQRLTLHFSNRSDPSDDFTYILLTSNKTETVSLLKDLQELSSRSKETLFGSPGSGDSVSIDNDDPSVLDAIALAVAPDIVSVVLHYQILQQTWRRGGRGLVRRVCVVTDSKLFLLDEDYSGDGSEATMAHSGIATSSNRLVDSAELSQIVQLQAADADPNAITIIIRVGALARSHYWRLQCRDGQGAERLVEDVRKAIRML